MRASLCTRDATGFLFSYNPSCSIWASHSQSKRPGNLKQIGLKMKIPYAGVPNPFKETRGLGMVMGGDYRFLVNPFRGEILALHA